ENKSQLVVLLTTVLLYCLFFIVFRDLGPAAIIIALTVLCLWAATARATTPLILTGLILLILGAVGYAPAFHWLKAAGTFRNRLDMWLDPWNTHFMNGDHAARILWSIASGGWFGLGSGTVNLRPHLPEATRDAAFAGIVAAMGLWVGL